MEGCGDSALIKLPVPENEGGYPDAHQFSVKGLPAYGFYIRYANNILFDNVIIIPEHPEARPAFSTGNDVENWIANGNVISK